jgi:peptidoglycan/LPS O-acetylase OafA/YrhL
VLVPLLMLLALSLPVTRAALEANEIWQEKAYLPGMAAIAIGVLGAMLVARYPRVPSRTSLLLAWLGLLGMGWVMLDGIAIWDLLRNGYMLVLTGAALCLVLASHWRSDKRPVPGLGWLRSWGRLSYEIYLTHMFVVTALIRLYKSAGGNVALGVLWYLPALPLCWLLGWLVEHYVSTPVERWLRQRWLGAPSPTMALAESP